MTLKRECAADSRIEDLLWHLQSSLRQRTIKSMDSTDSADRDAINSMPCLDTGLGSAMNNSDSRDVLGPVCDTHIPKSSPWTICDRFLLALEYHQQRKPSTEQKGRATEPHRTPRRSSNSKVLETSPSSSVSFEMHTPTSLPISSRSELRRICSPSCLGLDSKIVFSDPAVISSPQLRLE